MSLCSKDGNTTFSGSNIKLGQNITSTCTLNSSNISKITSKVKTEIKQTIQQWIDQQLQQSNGFVSTAINIGIQEGVNRTQIVDDLTNTISESVSNTCSAYVQNVQEARYYFCGWYENVNIDIEQTAAAITVATCLNKSILQAYASNQVLIDILQKADDAIVQKNAGIFDWIVTIIVAIVIASVIGTVCYYMFSGSSSDSTDDYDSYSGPYNTT
jgi:gas vesicle protein